METSSWGKTILGILIAGALGYLAFWLQTERERRELAEQEQELKTEKSALESLQNQNKALAELRDLYRQVSDLDEEKLSVTKELFAMAKEVRGKGVGQVAETLVLQDGSSLSNVKIQSVADLELTVSHSAGVAHVSWKKLPEEVVTRFRMNDPILLEYEANLKPKETPKAAPPIVAGPKVNTARVQELESKLATMDAQIQQLTAQRSAYLRDSSMYRSQAYYATSHRKPNSHMISARQAESQADAVQTQINTLQGEEDKVRDELSRAYAGLP